MSDEIIYELQLLWDSMVCGMILSVGYDVLRIFRRVCRQQKWSVGAQDVCYWLVCGILVFSLILRKNSGNIRWYHLAGIGMGAYLYFATISKLLVKYVSKFIQFILSPLRFFARQIKRLLKPLKNFIKMVRIRHKQKLNEKRQKRKNDKIKRQRLKDEMRKQHAEDKLSSKRGERDGKGKKEL